MTILPGDYSRNNVVDGTDHNIWLDHEFWGGLFQQGDANGDGMVDEGDSVLFNANSGMDLQDLVFADFNNDGLVDVLDEDILWSYMDMTPANHSQGDANGNGTVDYDDWYTLDWQFSLELDWVA